MSIKCINKTLCLTIFTASLYASGIPTALARWANLNDFAMETEKFTRHIEVNKDGIATTRSEVHAKITKEEAKRIWAHFPIPYNANSSKIKILEAKTIVNGKEYPVNANQIEDKPIASNVSFFDQKNQIILAYPHLENNATVVLKTITTNTHTALENFYSNSFTFHTFGYSKSNNIYIRSKLPLYVAVNDPEKILTIKQTTEQENKNKIYLIEINQNKPYGKSIINEGAQQALNPKHIASVSVSSKNNWNDLGKVLALDYEKIRTQPLPNLYKEIANIAKTKKTSIDKINTVTSLLAEKINYLSDVRTIKGRLVPQSLQKVADTRLGDCKDFSMATSIILASIGIPSKIALVQRGEGLFNMPIDVYSLDPFNHAIVKVELPEGALWIDPTNFTSMANHIFPDISDRKSLVLDMNHSTYETIPHIQAANQSSIKTEIWDMKNPSELQVTGSLALVGVQAYPFAGTQNRASDETLKYSILTFLGEQYGQVLSHKVELPNLKSRIVEDQIFNYTLTARNSGLKTSAGIAMPLKFNNVNICVTKKDTVGDTYLGTPSVTSSYTTIKNIKPIGTKSLDCNIESPWVNILRTVKYEKDQILVHQKMEVKKSWIEGKELESDEYKKLQLAIAQNFNNGIAIIFEPNK